MLCQVLEFFFIPQAFIGLFYEVFDQFDFCLLLAYVLRWVTCDGALVRDDPKRPNDNGEVPKLNGVVGGSIPGYEIISLLDRTSQVVKCLMYSQNKEKEMHID